MPNKLQTPKTPSGKNRVAKKSSSKAVVFTSGEAIVVKREAPKSKKATSSKKRVINAETAQVLRDAEAGKNLTTSVDADDLFRKLGIKIEKAKA
jgi:hypothetical protein